MSAQDILLSLLSELRAKGAVPSKTKLLKMVYLTDIEYYRSEGKTATGWEWIFHRFGPWTGEYDNVLDSLAKYDRIEVKPVGSEKEAFLIRSLESEKGWSAPQTDVVAQLAIGRVVARWARVDLGPLLDYVYFETEPMKNARRGDRLDFSTVYGVKFEVYRRPPGDPNKIAELQKRLGQLSAREQGSASRPQGYTPPKYDAEAMQLLTTIEDD